MMRSLYSGVAGLKTHQTKMDVIGNNIANVNTTAYKSASITFSDLMSQTTQNASGANAATGTGGTNAKQIGLGVKSGAINVNITGQGSAQSTGNPFDIMITGDNFFVVSNGSSNFFTRDGSFYVDGAGNLAMTSTGYNVMGWGVNEETGTIQQDSVSALRIMSAANMTYPPEATTKAYVSGILDMNDTDVNASSGKAINLNFYDSLGYSYTARLVFKASDIAGEYSVECTKILDSDGNELVADANDKVTSINQLLGSGTASTQLKNTAVALNTSAYKIDGAGQLTDSTGTVLISSADFTSGLSDAQWDLLATAYNYEGSTSEFKNLYIADAAGDPHSIESIIGSSTTGLNALATAAMVNDASATVNSFSADGRYYTGMTVNFDTATGAFVGVNGSSTTSEVTLNLSKLITGTDISEVDSNFDNVTINFKDMSMYNNNGTSTVSATSGDKDGNGSGRMLGDMIGVSVQNNGMIYASYDNGMTKLLGQIATANFANASGLEKKGDNLYSATLNSGEFDGIGVDITANGGYMTTGTLEMSNVDLSTEFTDMITTQRGFQANSRIITVSDTLLEELTNLKR